MNNRPIGVFDSGLGGLTAVRELRKILPWENIVYFGDTGRVPYGSRGRDTIISYAKQDIGFLLSKNVKAILAACGTISSTLPDSATAGLEAGYTGVVHPAAEKAAADTSSGIIGVLGTEATISSGSYEKVLGSLIPGVRCVSQACPLFVPLVENGHFVKGDGMVKIAAQMYLKPLKEAGVDTIILGCTHYPLLADVITQEMGAGVKLVDPGREAALALKRGLEQQGKLSALDRKGSLDCYVTDDPSKFSYYAKIFLGEEADSVSRINIEQYSF